MLSVLFKNRDIINDEQQETFFIFGDFMPAL